MDKKRLAECINGMPNDKVIEVLGGGIIPMEQLKHNVLMRVWNTLGLLTTIAVSGKKAFEVSAIDKAVKHVKSRLIKGIDSIDFYSIDSIIENLHILFFGYEDYDVKIKIIKDYIESKGVVIEELDAVDKSTLDNMGFVLSDFGFLPPDIFFENSFDDLMRLYIKIQEMYPKYNPYGAGRTYFFDFSRLLEELIKSYKHGKDFSKLLHLKLTKEQVEEFETKHKKGLMSCLSPSSFL